MANIAAAFAALPALEVFTRSQARDRKTENADDTEPAAIRARREAAETTTGADQRGAQDAGKPERTAGRGTPRPRRFATSG